MQQNVVGNNYESTELVDLHNTGLNTNCAGIELCKHARLLDLSFNKLTSPHGIASGNQQRTLTELRLSNNNLSGNVGQTLNIASNLRILELQNNDSLDSDSLRGLEQLKHLESLRVDGCSIGSCTTLGRITTLKELDISRNNLHSLDGLGKLTKIYDLNASFNFLTSLKGLSQCEQLRELLVSSNQIRNAREIKTLQHLDILNLSNNLINSLDALPPALPTLSELHLAENAQLNDISSIASRFPALELLNINGCAVQTVLEDAKQLENLAELNCIHSAAFSETHDVSDILKQVAHVAPHVVYVDDHTLDTRNNATAGGDSAQCDMQQIESAEAKPVNALSKESSAPWLGSNVNDDDDQSRDHNLSAGIAQSQRKNVADDFLSNLDTYRIEMESVFGRMRDVMSKDLNNAAETVRRDDGITNLPRPPVMTTVESIDPSRRTQHIMQRESKRHNRRCNSDDYHDDTEEGEHDDAQLQAFESTVPLEVDQALALQSGDSERAHNAFSSASAKFEKVRESARASESTSSRTSSTKHSSRASTSRPLSRSASLAPERSTPAACPSLTTSASSKPRRSAGDEAPQPADHLPQGAARYRSKRPRGAKQR